MHMKTHGLRFRKFDLHIHTPASKCFGDKFITPEQIVQKAIKEGISAIAITDHNTGEWIDKVKEAAKGSDLIVFPGVEITVGDARNHIIAILDIDKTTRHIEDLLTTLGIFHEKFGEKDAFSTKSVVETIEIIFDKFNGIAVPAHIDSTNGVFDQMKGEQRKQVIRHPKLLAAEAVNHAEVATRLNGEDKDYKTKLAVYQSSDNPSVDAKSGALNYGVHSVEGIGTRFSYFKVDEHISLESLRQCFIDPDVRIRQQSEYRQNVYPFIKKLKVDSGFLNGQEFEFNRGLNSILGAKGVGKSLLVEFMRFVLDQESTNAGVIDDHKQKLKEQLKQYGKVEILICDETGKEFQITRTYNTTDENPLKCTDLSTGAQSEVNVAQLFTVLFLSQTEIIKIAERQDEQMKFIDKFFDFHTYRNQIVNIERELGDLDRSFAEALKAYHGQRILDKQFKTSKLELERLARQLKNPIFGEFAKQELKDKAFRGQLSIIQSLNDKISEYEQNIKDENVPKISEELLEDPALKRMLDYTKQASSALLGNIREQKTKMKEIAKKMEEEYKSWKISFDTKKEEYQKAVVALGGDAQKLESQRKLKTKEVDDVEKKLILVKAKASQLKKIYTNRNLKLECLKKVYSEYYKARKEKCEYFETISNGKLQVIITESTNKDEFKAGLASLKKGSYIRESEIEQICRTIAPDEFIAELLRYDATRYNENAEIDKLIKAISEKASLPEDRIRNLTDHLLNTISYEDLLLLQYKAQPQDVPEIRYNISETKKPNYIPLKNLSTGQKCTAMIILSLSEGNVPVVIDQPEDSLDIRAIWDDMCSKIRKGKEQRQFIFTTHNSSVAVASDTDKFIIMTATADKGEVVFSGSIDSEKVKKEVIKYLEGGIKPYKLKYNKYDIPKRLGEEVL